MDLYLVQLVYTEGKVPSGWTDCIFTDKRAAHDRAKMYSAMYGINPRVQVQVEHWRVANGSTGGKQVFSSVYKDGRLVDQIEY